MIAGEDPQALDVLSRFGCAVDGAVGLREGLGIAGGECCCPRRFLVHVDESGRPEEEAAEEIASLVASRRAAAGLAGAEPAIAVLAGPTALSLPEAIEDLQPDLVAIGTHGRAGVAGFFLGSVAEALLDTLDFDFLISRARE